MLKISSSVQNLDKLEQQIKRVDKLLELGKDGFNKYLKTKVLETLEKVMNQRLSGGTTNDLEISLYRKSNHIRDTSDGFILYNDAKIPANQYNMIPFDTSGYPDGQFNIALAFEYGVGVAAVGSYNKGTSSFVPWEYNTLEISKRRNKKKEPQWYLPKSVHGESGILTSGYKGFEIYRFVVDEVNKNIKQWTNEYMNKKEV